MPFGTLRIAKLRWHCHMKYLLIAIFSLAGFALSAQAEAPDLHENVVDSSQSRSHSKALAFFKREHFKQKHARYNGDIVLLGNGLIQFSNETMRFSSGNNDTYTLICSHGLIYPELIFNLKSVPEPLNLDPTESINLSLDNIKEIHFITLPATLKRFQCWIMIKGWANPLTCYFELENPTADPNTDLADFITGSQLTFIKIGDIIL